MNLRFLHTADWQIGKVFRFVDAETMGVLQDARLSAIDRIGEIAVARELSYVLVAGDVYDAENLSQKSENQPIQRMRKYSSVDWYLLPGNHDPHRPNGLWHRLIKRGLPGNVHICVEARPIEIESGSATILPAPLYHKSTLTDPTEYMDSVDLPADSIRIGLAHGSITDFGSGDGHSKNYIDPARPDKAGLSYLALGDWHGQKKINARCWYSGTPETDAFGVDGGGKALIVSARSNSADPQIESVDTGHYAWHRLSAKIDNRKGIKSLEQTLEHLGSHLERVVMKLDVEGVVTLEEANELERVIDRLDASFRSLLYNNRHLYFEMTDDDLNRIDTGGFVRKAANRLKALSEQEDEHQRRLASLALKRLYVELEKLEASQI